MVVLVVGIRESCCGYNLINLLRNVNGGIAVEKIKDFHAKT